MTERNRQPSEPRAPMLSKSRFIAGMQCPLRLWNDVYRRELGTEWSDSQLAVFDRGSAIGELARQRYPAGVLVGFEPWEREAAIAETDRLMTDPGVPAIYEAAAMYEGVFVRVDVLARNGDGWDLIEVKAGTRPDKPVFQQDMAVQHWVLSGAGLKVVRAGLLVLNRDYVYPGGEYDLNELFRFADLTGVSLEMQGTIAPKVRAFHRVLAAEDAPRVEIGAHCFDPYDCRYYAHCSAGIEFPEHPVGDLPHLRGNRLETLEAMDIETIPEIPDDFELSAVQARVRQAVLSGQPWQSPELGAALGEAVWPLRYLDFESFSPALPRYPGTRPFDAIPFQFSLHVERESGATLEHHEYLQSDAGDPSRPLAEALLGAAGETGSIVVYSPYERRIIGELAARLPDLAGRLRALTARLWDLLPVVRNHYYHPDFRGSFSIKRVLPVLVPDAGWSGLEIADGQAAAMAYERAINADDSGERERVFAALRDYCRQDTLAMVRLRQALENHALITAP